MSRDWIVPDWPLPPSVAAIATTRHGPGGSAPPFDRFNLGARCGDGPEVVAGNRAALVRALGLPAHPRWLQQVHGRDVLVVTSPLEVPGPVAEDPVADAAVTAVPGAVLAVLTADCLPVLLASDDGVRIGAAHAGWRGLAAGVLEATVAAMGVPPERLSAWLGPAAGREAYEVGDEVRATFASAGRQAATAFVPTRPGHWHMDLYALARQRLAAAGVWRVHGGGFCTISDRRFYSHRRDGRCGRMASLIWMKS